MKTRIIGIDLAVKAKHKAIVLDQASNKFVSPVISFHTDPAELDELLKRARTGETEEIQLVAVMEATGMAWFPLCTYLMAREVIVYRVNGQQVAELRRIYKRRAKSDRIDVRVLARLPLVYPDRMQPLYLPSGQQIALQRACREADRLRKMITASKNRLLATDQFAWLGLANLIPPFGPRAHWVRSHWYNPWQVLQAGEETLAQAWQEASPTQPADISWLKPFLARAQVIVDLYGQPDCLDYDQLQASLHREQERYQAWRVERLQLQLKTIRPLYRQLHPNRYVDSLQGIGQDSAAVYIAFIGDIRRFSTISEFRGWSGMLPFSVQSGQAEARGMSICKGGPDLLKATAFLNANVARQWDPQIAAVYYRQMMDYGKHHNQAVCACASHLLNRVYTILKEERPYELRDVDGTPVTKAQARRICQEQYRVPAEVRRRNNYRARKARAEQRVEQRYLKKSEK